MAAFELALLLILLLAALSMLGRRLPWPQPITFALGGALAAMVPTFPRVTLDPGFFFLCFVPPLLFSDGWLMPLRDFIAARRPILMLATGLVVGFVAWWLVPGLPLAMGFALGAVVSPTDAVAVSAITHRLKVPPRFTTVLSGESLMNDATGLVAFKFALAAVFAGAFSLRAAALNFLWVALAGLAVGFAVAWLVGRVRDLLLRLERSDEFIEITLSLLTPYAAYLAAEALHLSGILAVVAAGLYSGWRDPLRMSVRAPDDVDRVVGRALLAQRPRVHPARAAIPRVARDGRASLHRRPARSVHRRRVARGDPRAARVDFPRRVSPVLAVRPRATQRATPVVANGARRRLGRHARQRDARGGALDPAARGKWRAVPGTRHRHLSIARRHLHDAAPPRHDARIPHLQTPPARR
jgi:hypothetical protein